MENACSAPAHASATTAPRAVLFDAYGTLFDVYSVALLAEQLFPGRGQALALLWRDKQIDYSRLVTTANGGAHYQPFWALTQAALVYALRRLIPELDAAQEPATVSALMNQYRHLSAFPENREVLQALKARGVVTGILSNGDPEMMRIAMRSAGMEGLLDHVLSADSVRKFKPHPEVYALGPQATGLKPSQILFVSSNGWDALGATWYGYTTLWVNRQQQPFETLGPAQPSRIGSSLHDVLSFFG